MELSLSRALGCSLLLACANVLVLSRSTIDNEQPNYHLPFDCGTVAEKRSNNLLSFALEQLSKRVDSLESSLRAKTEKTSGSLEKTVAFYAGNSHATIFIAPDGTVVLDTAFTNVGNGYDTTTGVFTAPVSGLYDLQAMFMQHEWAGKDIYAWIKIEERSVAEGVADNRGESWDLASIRAIVHVSSGQKVTLASSTNDVYNFYGGPYTTFSGFLIKAD
ncbi:complement C1q-like protein 3 [Littorina saxatilis]|uniref:complement C1q-like protein 3 n=1 Tax=Littorina saxatilis TaxID=31220 RepID=UPI0038B46676